MKPNKSAPSIGPKTYREAIPWRAVLNRLADHALGKCDMSASERSVALALLDRLMPRQMPRAKGDPASAGDAPGLSHEDALALLEGGKLGSSVTDLQAKAVKQRLGIQQIRDKSQDEQRHEEPRFKADGTASFDHLRGKKRRQAIAAYASRCRYQGRPAPPRGDTESPGAEPLGPGEDDMGIPALPDDLDEDSDDQADV